MLRHSRVTGQLDTSRVAQAVTKPGIDPRIWVSYAFVTKVVVDPVQGVFANVILSPSQVPETVRVGYEYAGSGFGIYNPLRVDDEVLVIAPSGDPNEGMVITQRMYSASDPPPQEAVDHPDDPVFHVRPGQTLRIVVEDGGNVIIDPKGQGVQLGGEDLGDRDGLVQGTGNDPFTGLPYWFLGVTSGIVKGAK